MESFFIALFLFILGTCIGSFLSVVIVRVKNEEKGIILGRSQCPSCKKTLQRRDLIPLLSFLINQGKCRYCHKKISWIYPILELLTGMIFAFNYIYLITFFALNGVNILKLCLITILSIALIAITIYDILTKEIPNIFLYIWIILSVLYALILKENSLISIIIALIIVFSFFGGQILISKGQWLGSGDLFFAIGMAILLGYEQLLVAIITSYLLGSFISVSLILTKQLKRSSEIPFTPFLALGTFIALYFGKEIFLWYISSSLISV